VRQAAGAPESAGYVLQDEVRGSVQVVHTTRQWRRVALQLAQAMVLA
jgi:hypothetical protein